METPFHVAENCSKCIFLGTIEGTRFSGKVDLYWCTRDNTPVARYGSEAHEYVSGKCFIRHYRELALAASLAIKQNLINENKSDGAFEELTLREAINCCLKD
jgi:hypothetical protein